MFQKWSSVGQICSQNKKLVSLKIGDVVPRCVLSTISSRHLHMGTRRVNAKIDAGDVSADEFPLSNPRFKSALAHARVYCNSLLSADTLSSYECCDWGAVTDCTPLLVSTCRTPLRLLFITHSNRVIRIC